MLNNKIDDVKRVAGACAYDRSESAGGVTPQSWTSTWHRARPGSNQYDEIGRRLGLSIDGSLLYSNSYDGFSRLTDTQIGTATSTYSYIYTNANPLVQSLTRPNGSVTTYQYDSLNRLATLSNQNSGSTVINQYSYVYSNDLRSSETVTNGSAITFSNDLITYDYNAVNQLLASTNTNSNQSFTYDADGNMTRGYTVDGYIFSAAYDAENRLDTLEYTDVSSVVHKTEYQYSGDDFLAIMKKYDAGTLTNETRFVRYGLLPLQERDSSNNVTREYAWGLGMGGGIGGLLNVKQSGQNYSYLYDGKGNVTAVIDSAEATAVTYTYDAFGNLMVKTGSLDQPFQFSTKRFDAQTGLVYYGYRFYSPAQGRWITRDPLGEAGGVNLYVFVGENPLNFIDPNGLAQAPAPPMDMKDVLRILLETPPEVLVIVGTVGILLAITQVPGDDTRNMSTESTDENGPGSYQDCLNRYLDCIEEGWTGSCYQCFLRCKVQKKWDYRECHPQCRRE